MTFVDLLDVRHQPRERLYIRFAGRGMEDGHNIGDLPHPASHPETSAGNRAGLVLTHVGA